VFGILIALAAACGWGLGDFLGGLYSRRWPVPGVLFVVEGAGLVVLGIVVAVVAPPFPDTSQMLWAIGAGAGGLVALGLFYRALAIGSMSIVAPIAATGAILPVVVGIAGGDRVTVLIGAGLVVAMVGILLASREAEQQSERSPAVRQSVLLALGAAVGFGLFFIGYDRAADGGVLWTATMARTAAVPLTILAVLVTRSQLPRGRDLLALCGAGQLDCAAIVLYALAATKADLAVVAVVGSLYPVVTVMLARFFLGERLQTVQAVGVVAALTGVVMVSLGSA
jgi:drug/metabolite transporter (DMT)-like permease